jgi:hypothetical protein
MGPSAIHSDESLEELHTSAAELRRLAVDRRRKTAEALTRSYRALFRGRWYPSARASRRVHDGQAVVYDLITRPVIAKERLTRNRAGEVVLQLKSPTTTVPPMSCGPGLVEANPHFRRGQPWRAEVIHNV